MHTIAVLALDGTIAFDLATPLETFARTTLPDGTAPYVVKVCALTGDVDMGAFRLATRWRLGTLEKADTVIIPGRVSPALPLPDKAKTAIRRAARRGARIASICAGAFTLADTGLLDGLRATTHWAGAAELARRHPSVTVDPNVLFVDNGQILTSAGAAAGLDLCLHLIRRDYGSAVAANAARLAVMPLERDGGQAQFIVHEPPTPDGLTLEPLLRWMECNAHRELTLADLAVEARLSTRTLSRRFRDQTGTTPLQWLHRSRLRRAQHLLETTAHPIDRIAADVGFGSPTTFRDRFKALVGTTPQAYRRSFHSQDISPGIG
jgi:transcriptional regulator GlxA family with amidase domain